MKCLQKVEKGLGLDKYIPCVKRVEILENHKITSFDVIISSYTPQYIANISNAYRHTTNKNTKPAYLSEHKHITEPW